MRAECISGLVRLGNQAIAKPAERDPVLQLTMSHRRVCLLWFRVFDAVHCLQSLGSLPVGYFVSFLVPLNVPVCPWALAILLASVSSVSIGS